jgi:hypothetical protein
VGCNIDDFVALVGQLDDVAHRVREQWTAYAVDGGTFAYLWPRTSTVGLKQTLAEQHALVAERPEVFEVQYTSPLFGWVVVHLEGVQRDELAELTFEAWRLTAPAALVEARADRLPV